MAWLFERLVTQLLTESGGRVRVLPQRTSRLDIHGRLTIKPDLVFADGPSVVAVADTKYKLLDGHGAFPNADAYQLVTYCARLGLDVGHLIYAAGEPRPEPYDIVGTGTRLVIHSIDLNQPVADLERQVRILFADITLVIAVARADPVGLHHFVRGYQELGELGGVGFLDPVGGFPFGDHVVAVGAGFVGGEVAALVRGPDQDFIGRGAFRSALVAQLVEQVGHRCSWSISH
jgi:hypothetical protein